MTEATAHQIETAIHGHYLLRAAEGDGPSPLLLGFHGYGEAAADHFAALSRIPGIERWTVCAPQGLRDFYRGRTGEVVASWMTRFNRELAIADNQRYVAAVIEAVGRQLPRTAGQPIVVSGFSQGVAMAYRAIACARERAAGVLALAGDVPPDVAEGDGLAGFPPVLIGRGTGDEWYHDGKLQADVELLTDRGVAVETEVFEGGHEWGEPFLARAGEFLAKIAGEAESS
jgi:predicted esterase